MKRKTNRCSRKRRKISDPLEDSPAIDRLSELPNDILFQILSLLPTKSSVATSVLSRRWRSLWTHIPHFDLDEDNIRRFKILEISHRFMLLSKVENLITLRLVFRGECCDFELETLIIGAIALNIQNLDLSLFLYRNPSYFSYSKLPRFLFTCGTLVDLRLQYCGDIPADGACLPSLRKLHLSSVVFKSDESLTRLISGCPVLDELLIDRIFEDNLYVCIISSPTIKRLTMNYLFDDPRPMESFQYVQPDYAVEINCPALTYLKVENWITERVSSVTPTSLVEADVYFKTYFDSETEEENIHTSALDFFASLCNVESLKLSCRYKEFVDIGFTLSRFGGSNLRFDNLTKLDVAAHGLFLAKLLEKADNLEVLIIRKFRKDVKRWVEPEQVPRCLLSHITSITVHEFDDSESDFGMVRYLLRSAEVLKKMEVYIENSITNTRDARKAKRDARKRISQLSKDLKHVSLSSFDVIRCCK